MIKIRRCIFIFLGMILAFSTMCCARYIISKSVELSLNVNANTETGIIDFEISTDKNIYVVNSIDEEKEIQYDESDYEIGPILKTNLSYLTYLLNETQKIYQKIPLTHKIQKEKLKEKIDMIKFCIKKAK